MDLARPLLELELSIFVDEGQQLLLGIGEPVRPAVAILLDIEPLHTPFDRFVGFPSRIDRDGDHLFGIQLRDIAPGLVGRYSLQLLQQLLRLRVHEQRVEGPAEGFGLAPPHLHTFTENVLLLLQVRIRSIETNVELHLIVGRVANLHHNLSIARQVHRLVELNTRIILGSRGNPQEIPFLRNGCLCGRLELIQRCA